MGQCIECFFESSREKELQKERIQRVEYCEKFVHICQEGDLGDLKRFINHLDQEGVSYKKVFDISGDVLSDLYRSRKQDMLNYLLDLEWSTELYINGLFALLVEDNKLAELQQLTSKHSVNCLGFGDYDLYKGAYGHAIEHNYMELANWLGQTLKTYDPSDAP